MPKQTATKTAKKEERSIAVGLRFTPEELADFKASADAESRPVSSFIRLAALRGLADFKRDPRALVDLKSH